MDSKLPLDTWGSSPQCLPRDVFQPDIMNPRPANKPAPPRDAAPVSCGPAKAQRSHPLSGSATAHTRGLPPPAPESSTCSVNRPTLLGFPPINGGLLTTLFCPLAFSPHHLSGRAASIPQPCTESDITSPWVQVLASVQEWCERE